MKIINLFLLLNCVFIVQAQNIKGIWQKDSPLIGSGYSQNYQFKNEEDFEYNTSEFDFLNRVRTIGGKYQIKQDTIFFTLEYIIECCGGTIERSLITSLNNSWAINDCKTQKTFFQKKETWSAVFKFDESDPNNKFIKIDNDIYYLTYEDN